MRSRRILIDEQSRHRQVSGDRLGILFAEGLQLVTCCRIEGAGSDILGKLGLGDALGLGRAGRTCIGSAVIIAPWPGPTATVAPRATVAVALPTRGAPSITVGGPTISAAVS
ncbi:hypothetical protein [Microbacterium kunmingense]|uniref:hypothetical protein n=1 Tax=Microbacterium kunmingense TaxID=2915939 RepID=UPI0020040F2A|nr:hypothetical protein [Microbacterium kunmingense]